MKLLVFAHTPPPHHGQSFMVEKMLEAFGGDQRKLQNRSLSAGNLHGIKCYHVNARVSNQLEDIGDLRIGKFLLMLVYCAQAIWCRFRYGVRNLYYVPAPGKRSALYRDWLVMALCRPFFKRVILHWHASGLAKWLETTTQARSRVLTYHLSGTPDLSIVLSQYGRMDAEKLYSRNLEVVGNGVIDPCPNFYKELLPVRKARLAARLRLLAGAPVNSEGHEACKGHPAIFKVLFLSHCSREKGLFETMNAVLLANRRLQEKHSPIRMQLTIAGAFLSQADKAEFDRILSEQSAASQISYAGFAAGVQKQQLFHDTDVFCFPSYLESFGLVLAEAMAYGLPIVATRCGALPELLPKGYPFLVRVGNAEEVAEALEKSITSNVFETHRSRYEERFTMDEHLTKLAAAIKSVEGRATPAFADWEHLPSVFRSV